MRSEVKHTKAVEAVEARPERWECGGLILTDHHGDLRGHWHGYEVVIPSSMRNDIPAGGLAHLHSILSEILSPPFPSVPPSPPVPHEPDAPATAGRHCPSCDSDLPNEPSLCLDTHHAIDAPHVFCKHPFHDPIPAPPSPVAAPTPAATTSEARPTLIRIVKPAQHSTLKGGEILKVDRWLYDAPVAVGTHGESYYLPPADGGMEGTTWEPASAAKPTTPAADEADEDDTGFDKWWKGRDRCAVSRSDSLYSRWPMTASQVEVVESYLIEAYCAGLDRARSGAGR